MICRPLRASPTFAHYSAETKMPPQAFSDAYHDDMNVVLFLLAALLTDHTWGRTPTGNMWVHRLGRPFV